MDEYDVENGSHWKAPYPALHETIAQWMHDDVWVLMTAPYKARHGGTAQMPVSDPDASGRIFYSREELARRLHKNRYTPIKDRTVAVIG